MSRYLFLLCAAVLSFVGYELNAEPAATEQPTEFTESELNAYYASIKAQVDKQNALVEDMMQSLRERKTLFSQAQRAQMEQAIVMLDVKRTLYANFVGTESIKKSPLVRQKLLQVLSQSDITKADLASLQALVQQEKNRYNIR